MMPIEKESIVNKVVKEITDAIIKGELKPGDKIPTEIELIETLNVGRNSIREAIKILSALGILEIRRGDGTYITKTIMPSILDPLIYSIIIEQSSSDEIFELREALEEDILELAVEKATEEDIDTLRVILDQSQKAFENNDIRLVAELDLKFHFALIEMARNPLLGRITKGVMQMFFSSIHKALEDKFKVGVKFNENHSNIINLIVTRDKKSIREVITKSLVEWKYYIK